MFEFFIAKRYLRSKHKINFITIITLLSSIGVMIGVAALVVMLSVFNGFGSLVTSMLVEFDPHIRIANVNEYTGDKNELIKNISQINEVENVGFYAEGKIFFYSLFNLNAFFFKLLYVFNGVFIKIQKFLL